MGLKIKKAFAGYKKLLVSVLMERSVLVSNKLKRGLRKKPVRHYKFKDPDKKLIQIARSTRTTLPALALLHNHLRMKYKWYYHWHLLPHINKIHIGLGTFSTAIATALIFSIVFNALPGNIRANNYTKIWTSTADFESGTNANISTASNQAALASSTANASEDFTTTTYKDAATDATWDSVANKLTLPGDPSSGVATDLQTKWKLAVGTSEIIQSSVYDSTNRFIYLGGSQGSFVAYNPANQTVINLTPKILADWSAGVTYALVFDSANGKVYLAGQTGRFGVFTGGADPANGTWVCLTSKISADWSGVHINALAFDSTNGKIYLGGASGKFGVFTGGADPANGTWVYLTSKISADWSVAAVNSLVYDSTNNKIYLGGSNYSSVIRFGVFTGGADPANGTWVYLTSKISTDWSTSSIYVLTFDSTNGEIYLGGDSGRFGVFTGGADPANGTWVYLTSKISADWSTSIVYALAFDSTNGKIYLGGASGKFGVLTGGADPANGTWVYLSSNVVEKFVGYEIKASVTDTTNNIIYLGGVSGKFAAYKISDGTTVNLTAKISANWGTASIYALAFDSTNSKVYLGGGGTGAANLGVFTGGADPTNGTWAYLTTQLATPDFDGASYWSTNIIYTLAFDYTNGYVYLGGAAGKFGAVQATATPGSVTTWTYLTTQLTSPSFASSWSTNQVYALTFDSTNSKIYLGGNGGKFGTVQATATPGDVTGWTYLTTQLATPDFDGASYWTNSPIYALAFDYTNGYIYLGGASGKFGTVQATATPGDVTGWTYLTTQLATPDFDNASYWSTSTIYSLVFAGGKIFLGGASGKFGVFTGGATPGSVTTWNYLYSNISNINGINQINTLIYVGSVATIYIGSATGNFNSFLIGYTSDKNGFSLAVDNTAQPISKATLTATDSKPTNTAINYYLSSDGGVNWSAVSSGVEHTFAAAGSDLRWKANMTTTDASVTPELTIVAISYNYFTANSGTMSLIYDASQAVVPTQLSWNHTLPTNTTLTFKVRSATSSGGLSAATWSDTVSAGASPVNLKTINVGGTAGVAENQFSEVYITMATSDGLDTPVLADLTEQYVINAAPELQTLTATQTTDGTKIVNINYQMKDSDSSLNPYNQDQVSVAFQYSLDSGGTWENCTTVTNTGLQDVNTDNTWATLTAAWNVGTDLTESYYNGTVQIRINADDNEQAHNTASLDSTSLSVDTTDPVINAISGGGTGLKVNDGGSWTNSATVDLTLSATDDTTKYMEVRNDTSYTGTKEAYSTSKADWALSATDGAKTVFVRFYDAFGNSTDASFNILLDTTASATPTGFQLFDASDYQEQVYSIIAAWTPISDPGDFSSYTLERKTDIEADWSTLATFTNIASDIYNDKVLNSARTYSYRFRATDIHTNGSPYTEIVSLQPVGTDTIPPAITGPGPTTSTSDITATISWITDKPSDSYVEFGATTDYGTIQGGDTLTLNHSVDLIGLTPSTTYQFRVKSRDASSNRVTSTNGNFTTQATPDTEAPVIVSNTAPTGTTGDSATVTVYATDNIGVTSTEISVNSGDWTTMTSAVGNKYTYAVAVPSGSVSTIHYRVRASDAADHTTTDDSKDITVSDNDVPIISANTTGTATTGDTLAITVSASDNLAITTAEISFDNGNSWTDLANPSTDTYTYSYTVPASATTVNYQVKFIDAAANTTTDSKSVSVSDNDAPAIISNTTSDATTGDSLTVTVFASDNIAVSTAEISWNAGSSWSDLTSAGSGSYTYSYTVPTTATSLTYSIKLKDATNNETTADRTITVTDTIPPVITSASPTVTAVDVSATIAWTTDKNADSYIEFGTTSDYGHQQGQDDAVLYHSVELVGLNPITTYHYRVKSKSVTGNQTVSTDYTFTTTLPVESEDSPQITGSTAQKPGADPEEVTIIWTTDRYTSSQVFYGTDSAVLDQQTTKDIILNRTHTVGITHLKPNTKYYYKAYSEDTYSNEVWGELKYFITATSGLETPTITAVKATDLTLSSAIISWNTTTVATSIVEVGLAAGTYDTTIEDQSLGSTTNHLVRLSGLTNGATYHFRVLGRGSDQHYTASDDYTFATIPLPVISDIKVSNVASDGATISWRTNIDVAGTIVFGTDKLDQTQGDAIAAKDHSLTLRALKPAVKYQFSIKASDFFGDTVISDPQSFTTIVDTTPPIIKDMKSEVSIITDQAGSTSAQAIISWSTDEPATSQIRYAMGVAAGDDYPLSTTEDTNLTTSHILIITNLKSSSTYHLKLISKDGSGNIAASDDYTVLTLNQQKSLLQYVIQILEEKFSWIKGLNMFK